MAAGRLLIVHELAASRAWLADLLSREGYRVEAVESSFQCLSRHLEEPAELVLLGLMGLAECEIELVRTLKQDPRPPRVLLAFSSPRRDLAVRALEAGADGYLLEPFYGNELLHLVRGQLAPRAAAAPSAALPRLAREIAHAVGNPLQVVTLLLHKEKVTKRDLTGGLPPQMKRIETVVGFLRDFGTIGEPAPRPGDPTAVMLKAAKAAGVAVEATPLPPAMVDERALAVAMKALFVALLARCGEGAPPRGRLGASDDAVLLEVFAPAGAFAGEKPAELLDAVFSVQPDRETLPGLALPRVLLEAGGGSLAVRSEGDSVVFAARLPRAR